MKKRLIIILLCVSCIPLIIASTISYRMFEAKIIADYNENSLERASAIQNDVHYFINRNLEALKLLTQNRAVVSMDPAATKPVLVKAAKDYPDVVFIVDSLAGQQLVRSDDLKLVEVGDRPFFKRAAAGNVTISEVLISRATNLPSIILAVPIRDDSGTMKGVAQGPLILNILDKFMKERSINGSTVFLVDQEGKILAHPDSEMKPEERDISKLPYVQTGLSGKNGTVEITNRKGQKALVNYTFDKENGWLTCIETPNDVLLGHSRLIMYQMLALLAVTILLVGATGYFIAGRVVNPLSALVYRFKDVAGGNLAVEEVKVVSGDEIGQLGASFNAMLGSLRGIVRQVADSAQQVAASSEQLTASANESAQATNQVAATIGDLAAGVDGQLKSIQETSQVVGGISAAIGQVTANTAVVAASSDKTARAASDGEEAIDAAVSQMGNIETVVANSAQAVGKLGERSKEIGQIIVTISDIAGQTNLLALNAAIEAARAGEQGRGFAVVAEEVRKLAEQSQEAAKKIGLLVGEIQDETTAAVNAMTEGVQAVKVGSDVVSRAGSAFSEITELIKDVSGQVAKTSSVVQQTAQGSQQVVDAVRKIETICRVISDQSQTVSAATQEQSASMEEVAASSHELAKLAEQLQAAVRQFRV